MVDGCDAMLFLSPDPHDTKCAQDGVMGGGLRNPVYQMDISMREERAVVDGGLGGWRKEKNQLNCTGPKCFVGAVTVVHAWTL